MPLTHDGRRSDPSFDLAVGLPEQRRPAGPPPEPHHRVRSQGGPGAPRPGHGRHRVRLRHLLLVVVAAIGLVPATAATLGLVGIAPGQFGLGADTEPDGPTAVVGGADGVFPGGPAAAAEVGLTNPDVAATRFDAVAVTAVSGDGSCPQAAWRVAPPAGGLPTIDPGATVRAQVGVALAPDAPDACQGLVAHLTLRLTGTSRAGRAQSRTVAVTARTATLGTPTASVAVHDGTVTVVPAAGPAGPGPSGFDVTLVDGKGAGTVLCAATSAGCPDRAAPAAGRRRYRVTARLAVGWHRVGPVVEAWTPPPGPALSFAGSGTSRLRVQAPGGAADYEVALLADGVPVLTWPVPAGTTLARTVPAPSLGAGRHRLVAVSRFQGWRAPSSTLRVVLGVDGTTTSTDVEAPDPVTVDPAAPPVVTIVAPPAQTTGAPEAPPQPTFPTRTLNPVVHARPLNPAPIAVPAAQPPAEPGPATGPDPQVPPAQDPQDPPNPPDPQDPPPPAPPVPQPPPAPNEPTAAPAGEPVETPS